LKINKINNEKKLLISITLYGNDTSYSIQMFMR